jgi:hypothetical protein
MYTHNLVKVLISLKTPAEIEVNSVSTIHLARTTITRSKIQAIPGGQRFAQETLT